MKEESCYPLSRMLGESQSQPGCSGEKVSLLGQ